MIDLHSHILPGIDDGPATEELTLDLARAAVADGIGVIAATPHVRTDYPTTPLQMEQLVAATRDLLAAAAVPLELLPGAEIAIDMLPRLTDDDLRRLGLGGNPSCLLVETPYVGWPAAFEEMIFGLQLRGFRVVLSHPERNAEVSERPARLGPLVERGALMQLTAASLDGRLGKRPQKTATQLLDLGLAHLLASDAHAPAVRHVGLSAAVKMVGDDALARWLTEDVPGSIVDATEPPPRPARQTRRRRFLSRD